LCSCCPITKSQSSSTSTPTTCTAIIHDPAASQTSAMSAAGMSPSGGGSSDARSSSVAELRRKAQEHSAALLHSLHAVAVSGLSFPGLHFPPLSLHHALSNRNKNGHHHLASDYISDLSLQHNNNNNNNIISKVEPSDKVDTAPSSIKNNSD
jgi:OAR motif